MPERLKYMPANIIVRIIGKIIAVFTRMFFFGACLFIKVLPSDWRRFKSVFG